MNSTSLYEDARRETAQTLATFAAMSGHAATGVAIDGALAAVTEYLNGRAPRLGFSVLTRAADAAIASELPQSPPNQTEPQRR